MLFKRLNLIRCFLFILAIGLVIIFFCNVISVSAYAKDYNEMQQIVVRDGDTLWNIVEAHCDYNGDIRSVIHEVKQINCLKSSEIFAGQVLYLPL